MNKIKAVLVSLISLFATLIVSGNSFFELAHESVKAQALDPISGANYYADNQNDLYYQGIDEELVGEDLIVALSSLTSTNFVSKSYSSLPDIYRYSDVSLSNPSKMQLIYTGTEVSFSPGSMPSSTNKEHVWPASWYGNGTRTESAGSPGADAHNIWPSATSLNSKRGSCAFDELNFATSYKSYEFSGDWSYGTVGNNDSYVWSTAFNNSNGQPDDALYPSEGHRGAIARILMYVATRYRNDTRYPVMLHDEAITLSSGRIGKLSTLLKWHYQEPPSAWEIKRNNEVAARWHHNRNPFVDHPEYAGRIYYHLPEPDQNQPTEAVKYAIETYGEMGTSISLNHPSLKLAIGSSQLIQVLNNPDQEPITWESQNASIASVNAEGLIEAHSVGTVTIYAHALSSSASCIVTVYDPNIPILIDSITFSSSSGSLRVGETLALEAQVAPSNASDKTLTWFSSNSAVATVDASGRVTALNQGTSTISASSNDGTNQTALYQLTVNPALNHDGSGWVLVEDVSSLKADDQLIIASNNGFTAGSLNSTYLTSLSATFSQDKKSLTTMNVATLIFTLGGNAGAWTLNHNGALLYSSGAKIVDFSKGTQTWTISISQSNATIQSTTSEYGRILYNVSAPRFTTYTSTTSSSMLLPQLYRYTNGEEESVKTLAYEYVSDFMQVTSQECLAMNVQLSTWLDLKDSYQSLDVNVQDYIYDHAEVDDLIHVFVIRYSIIIDKYDYDNFLVNSHGDAIVSYQAKKTAPYQNNEMGLYFLLIMLSIGVIGVLIYRQRRQTL